MKKISIITIILTVFFLIGCSIDYKCQIDTKIDPKIHIIGKDKNVKILIEYNLGPVYVLDQLDNISDVDAFFFHQKKDTFNDIRIKWKTDNYGLSTTYIHYFFNGKEYKGKEYPSFETIYKNRLEIPGIKWLVFEGVEYKDGISSDTLNSDSSNNIEEEQKERPKQNPSPKEKL